MKKYGLAINVLNQIKNNNEVAIYSRTKAEVEIGHCHYLNGNLAQAKAAFGNVENNFKNEQGAESQYMITKILFDEGTQFKNKEKQIWLKANLKKLNRQQSTWPIIIQTSTMKKPKPLS